SGCAHRLPVHDLFHEPPEEAESELKSAGFLFLLNLLQSIVQQSVETILEIDALDAVEAVLRQPVLFENLASQPLHPGFEPGAIPATLGLANGLFEFAGMVHGNADMPLFVPLDVCGESR